MRWVPPLLLVALTACGNGGASSPSETAPRATTPQTAAGTAAQDVAACQLFRDGFVYSDWGLLTSDEAAAAAVGSDTASAVAVAASRASSAIAAAGEGFKSENPAILSRAIDAMLLACSSVITK